MVINAHIDLYAYMHVQLKYDDVMLFKSSKIFQKCIYSYTFHLSVINCIYAVV